MTTATQEPPTQELELTTPEEAPHIDALPKADNQIEVWGAFRAQMEKLKTTAETLVVSDVNDKAGMKLARETRLLLREVRVAVEHKRVELGEEAMKKKKAIDTAAKEIKDAIEPLELRLKDQEEFIERETVRIQNEKRAARASELTPFLSSVPAVDLGALTDEQYAAMLTDAKDAHSARLAREQKVKEEAAAKAKAEAEAREAQRLENIRLKQEAEEREAAAKKEREEAAAALAAAQDKAREEAIAASKAREEEQERFLEESRKERERMAAERAAAEAKAKKEREAIEAAAAKENARLAAIAEAERQKAATAAREAREEREKAGREVAARKAEAEHAERERLAAIEAAAMAPEKEKLKTLAATVRAIVVPVLTTDKGIAAAKEITAKVESFANWITKQAAAL